MDPTDRHPAVLGKDKLTKVLSLLFNRHMRLLCTGLQPVGGPLKGPACVVKTSSKVENDLSTGIDNGDAAREQKARDLTKRSLARHEDWDDVHTLSSLKLPS